MLLLVERMENTLPDDDDTANFVAAPESSYAMMEGDAAMPTVELTRMLTAVVTRTGGFAIFVSNTVMTPTVRALASLFVSALMIRLKTGFVAYTSILGVATVSAPLHASSANALPVFPPAIAYVTSNDVTVEALSFPTTAPAVEPSGIEKLVDGNVGATRAQENGEPLQVPAGQRKVAMTATIDTEE